MSGGHERAKAVTPNLAELLPSWELALGAERKSPRAEIRRIIGDALVGEVTDEV